jgi:hypothetical protein
MKDSEQDNPKTVAEVLYWSYANLAMAHAAVTDKAVRYGPKHFMIRSRLFKGLMTGTMNMGTLFADEKEKMQRQHCSYCGSSESLSVDHLLAKNHGGGDSGDNLILACKSCNSSKGDQDLLLWYEKKGEFPPLSVLRRYLKLLHTYCRESNLMNVDSSDQILDRVPYAVRSLPNNYPAPVVLVYSH